MKKMIMLMAVACLFQGTLSAQDPVKVNFALKPGSKMELKLYQAQVLMLALDKTKKEYGDYEIGKVYLDYDDAGLKKIADEPEKNIVVMTTFRNNLLDMGLTYARFPIDYGVTGFRIFYAYSNVRDELKKIQNVNELKRFTIVQGFDWWDTEILKYNGFKIVTGKGYEQYAEMIASGKGDIFCHGVSEIPDNKIRFQKYADFDYDSTISVAYPCPRFFILSEKNTALEKRITRGLLLAYKDGSLKRLWRSYYGDALGLAKLRNRTVFYLKTPDIDKIDFDYQKYYFDPYKE